MYTLNFGAVLANNARNRRRPDEARNRREPEEERLATEGPASVMRPPLRETPAQPVVQTPELDAAVGNTGTEEERKPTFGQALLGLIGAGQQGALTSEEGRDLVTLGQQAGELNRESTAIVNWEGRDDLLKEYRRLRAAYDPSAPEGEVGDRMRAVLAQLRAGDEAAGNGVRDYTWGDRATSVISGAANEIGSSLASAAATVGQSYGRTAMMEQAGNMDQALRDIRFGENTGENVRAAIEAANEGNRAWDAVTEAADRMGESAAADLERAKNGMSGLGKIGVDIAENVIQMGFDAAVAALTGGGSLASMGLRTFGSAAREARLQGADLDQQVLYGTVKAGVETLTEKMFDGVAKIYGAGAADDIIEKAIGKLAQTDNGRTFLRLLSGAAGEGMEELVSGLLDPLAKAIYSGDVGSNYRAMDPSELLYDMLIGATIGLLGGGTSIATGQNAAANAQLRAGENTGVNAAAEAAAEAQAPAEQTPAEAAPAQTEAAVPEAQPAPQVAAETAQTPTQSPVLDADAMAALDSRITETETELQNLRTELQDTWLEISDEDTDRLEARIREVEAELARLQSEKDAAAKSAAAASAAALEEEIFGSSTPVAPQAADSAPQTEAPARPAPAQPVNPLAQTLMGGQEAPAAQEAPAQNPLVQTLTQQTEAAPEAQAPAQQTAPAPAPAAQETAPQTQQAAPEQQRQLTEAERQAIIREVEQDADYSNQIADYFDQMADKAEQDGNKKLAEEYRRRAADERRRARNGKNTSIADRTLGYRPAQSTPEGTRESQSPTTVQNSPVTNEEMAALIGQNREVGGYRYIPITNDETTQKATERIKKSGWESTLRAWSNDVHNGRSGAEMAAIGALLYNNAVNSGNTALALDILSDYTMLGRNTARGLQAMKIIQSLTPDARLYMIERQVDQLAETLKKQYRRRTAEMNEMQRGLPDGITIPEDLKDAYRNAQTEEERDQIVDQMQQAVADQIPSTLLDMWTALRYMNMLGNFRTQGRNLIGNTLMALTTTAKNGVLNVLEGIASKASGGRYERATSLTVDPALRQAAMEEFRENPELYSGESRYSDNNPAQGFRRDVYNRRTIFGSGARSEWASNALSRVLGRDVDVKKNVVEDYRLLTNWATEAGDRIFIGPRYARALAGYLQANGIDAATFRGIRDGSIAPTAEQSALLERARNFAMREAQESTFHDSNTLSDWVAGFMRGQKTPPFFRVLGEGLMPFRKTPANVFMRLFEYSPLGAFDTAVQAARANQADSDVNMNDVLNSAAKTLTGTGIMVLGALMRAAGRLRGHEDDDKQEAFDKLRGMQDYSYVDADGNSYTLDWASPVAGTLFMGSQLYDLIQEGGFQLEDIGEIFSRMSDPLIEMSMLQGLRDTLDDLKNSDNSLGTVSVNLMLNYLMQGVSNSLLGQAERTSEDRRYSTFLTSGTQFGRTMQYNAGRWSARTPGVDYNQIEYIDAWGRPDYNGSPLARGLENFLSPGYVSQNNSTAVDNELQRLYDAGMTNVFPQRPSQTMTLTTYDADGNSTGSRRLTADEFVTYSRELGQTSLRLVRELMDSAVYDSMSDEARAEAIKKIYSYARNIAAQAVEQTTKKDYTDVSALSNPGAYFGLSAAFSSATGDTNNRDYGAIDALLEEYRNAPADVQALLAKKNTAVRKLFNAWMEGVGSETYFHVADNIDALSPTDGSSIRKWQIIGSIGSDDWLSTDEQDYFMRQYFEGGTLEKYNESRRRGFKPYQIADFYRIFNTAGHKDDIINAAQREGFTRQQAEELYSMWRNGHW